MIKKLHAELDEIIEKTDKSEDIFDAEKIMLETLRPHMWNVYVDGNMETEMEVEFEKYLIMMADLSNQDLETMSAFKFYGLSDYLAKKYPKKK